MQRLLQLARHEKRHGSENAGEEALHVAGAAAVELAVTRGERERVASPSLAFDRDAVAMAGKPDAALAISRSDGGEQARLRSVLRGDQGRGNAVALEMSVLTYSMSFRFDFALVVSKATRAFSSS